MSVTSGEKNMTQNSVSSGLNLVLQVSDLQRLDALLSWIQANQDSIYQALDKLHFVHFARFLPTPDYKALQVITSFDGDFDAYVLDFVLELSDQFDKILSFMDTPLTHSVKDRPSEFLDFVRKNNMGYRTTQAGDIDLYSAYPKRTLIDIVGPAGRALAVANAAPADVVRSDVQANVLRGVNAKHGWHVGLRMGPVAGVRSLLGELLKGMDGTPTLSSDDTRPIGGARPPYWLNVGVTFDGLLALGLSPADQAAFCLAHPAFVRGPDDAEVAAACGDSGDSQPANWQWGGVNPLDMVVSIHADDELQLDACREALLARCAVHGLTVVNQPWRTDALVESAAPDDRYVHFGYVDGVGQPRLALSDEAPPPASYKEPLASVGEFLLGSDYRNVFGGKGSLDGLSPGLCQNGTFAALRILEQDVVAFEKLLDDVSRDNGVDREWVAAKLMGRWRKSGASVAVSPDAPPVPVPSDRDDFDYRPTDLQPETPDDSAGQRCPMGAHARRSNPRSALVAGRPFSRRLLRRGMPYGPKYLPEGPNDDVPRGIVGLFLCADLERQYEFILREWIQGDKAVSGIAGQQDPIVGAQATVRRDRPMDRSYRIPRGNGQADIVIGDMPRLVKTVGSVYLFMPGLAGVTYLATDPAPVPQPGASVLAPPPVRGAMLAPVLPEPSFLAQVLNPSVKPDPATFDPRAMDFRANPFPVYKWFRDNAPVAPVARPDEYPPMRARWVFNDKHLAEVANSPDRFKKRRTGDPSSSGILNMDQPPHTGCRREIGPMFAGVLTQIQPSFPAMVTRLYGQGCQGQPNAVDWMSAFAGAIAQEVFCEMFGISQALAGPLIDRATVALNMRSPVFKPDVLLTVKDRLERLSRDVFNIVGQALPDRMCSRIMGIDSVFDAQSNLAGGSLTALTVERLTNASTMITTSVLPLQWFIAVAVWRLLENDALLLKQIKADPAIGNSAVVEELLRFDMSTPVSERFVIANTTIGDDVRVMAGERLILCWPSASRDEAVYGPTADAIDFKRNMGHGWAFGAEGLRNCLGRDLVYAVMEPVIQTLRDASPEPRLADGFQPAWGTPKQGAMFRAMVALMIHG